MTVPPDVMAWLLGACAKILRRPLTRLLRSHRLFLGLSLFALLVLTVILAMAGSAVHELVVREHLSRQAMMHAARLAECFTTAVDDLSLIHGVVSTNKTKRADEDYLRTLLHHRKSQGRPLYRRVAVFDSRQQPIWELGPTDPGEAQILRHLGGGSSLYITDLRHPYGSDPTITATIVIARNVHPYRIVLHLDYAALFDSLIAVNGVAQTSRERAYASGKYAAVFDNEGWIILHPRYSHVRGQDSLGADVPEMTRKADEGKKPLNLIKYGPLRKVFAHYAAAKEGELLGAKYSNLKGQMRLVGVAPIRILENGNWLRLGGVSLGKGVNPFLGTLAWPTVWIESQNALLLYILGLMASVLLLVIIGLRVVSMRRFLVFIEDLPADDFYRLCSNPTIIRPRHITLVILNADIRKFRDIVQQTSVQDQMQLSNFVRDFRRAMSKTVKGHTGYVCNAFNDQIVAVFGSFRDQDPIEPFVESATLCGLEMQVRFEELALKAGVNAEATLGIGIATGDALIGNLGKHFGPDFNFGVLGPPISVGLVVQVDEAGGKVLVEQVSARYLSDSWLIEKGLSKRRDSIRTFPDGSEMTVFSIERGRATLPR